MQISMIKLDDAKQRWLVISYKVAMFINLKKLKIQILSLKRKRKSESLLKIYELHLKMDNYPRMYFHLTFSMLNL